VLKFQDKFTKYGFDNNGTLTMKNWFPASARFENHHFVVHSNENLDDIANAPTDYQIEMKVDSKFTVTTDLNQLAKARKTQLYKFSGEKRTDFSIFIEPKASFYSLEQ
jgi:hypothetical protein